MKKYAGYFLFVVGFLLMIFVRVDGIDMTERQILVNYFPLLLLSVGCLLGGYAILSKLEC